MRPSILWCGITSGLWLCSCSDFQLGYTPGGNPPPPVVVVDTLRDTTIVAADSVIVRPKFYSSDTLLDSTFHLRAGNYAELEYRISADASIDSLDLYGLTVSPLALAFSVNQGRAAFHAPDTLSHTTAGNTERYQFSVPGIAAQNYGMRIYNTGPTDQDLSGLFLVGYSHPDSLLSTTIAARFREIREVATRAKDTVYAHTQVWIPIPVIRGDSLHGSVHPSVGLAACILSSAEMADLIHNGVTAQGYWDYELEGKPIELAVAQADTLFYLVQNNGATNLLLGDTLRLVHPY